MILNLTNREGCYFFSFITLITYASIQLIFARNLSDWFGLLFILFPCLLLLRAAYTKDKECIKISYLAFCIIGIPFIAFMIFINFIWRSRSSLLSLFFFLNADEEKEISHSIFLPFSLLKLVWESIFKLSTLEIIHII